MISVRFEIDVERQAGDAAFAVATAASTSAAVAKSTLRACRPVAGSYTIPERPDEPGTIDPPIQWLTLGMSLGAAAGCSASCVMSVTSVGCASGARACVGVTIPGRREPGAGRPGRRRSPAHPLRPKRRATESLGRRYRVPPMASALSTCVDQ